MNALKTIAAAAILAAGPALADEVNIYSYRQPDLVKPLTKAFTKETGIKVNIAFLQKGMIEKMTAEGRRSPVDLVLTTDISRLHDIVEAGLAQPVTSEILAANIPAEFRDPGDQWFGLTSRARVVFAAKDRVAEGAVTTYEDLADPKWRGRICTRSGTHSYTLALVSAFLAHHGEAETRAWLEGVKANLARKPQGNDRAQVKAIWSGECDISLGNTYYMGEMLAEPEQKDWADAVRIVFPVFEDGGTHVNLSGVAMAKHAPNRDAALTFIEWLSSPEAQTIYAEANYEYPLLETAETSDLVASWGDFTADGLNLMDVARLRGASLRLVEEVDFDG